jgi:hypothetical protein
MAVSSREKAGQRAACPIQSLALETHWRASAVLSTASSAAGPCKAQSARAAAARSDCPHHGRRTTISFSTRKKYWIQSPFRTGIGCQLIFFCTAPVYCRRRNWLSIGYCLLPVVCWVLAMHCKPHWHSCGSASEIFENRAPYIRKRGVGMGKEGHRSRKQEAQEAQSRGLQPGWSFLFVVFLGEVALHRKGPRGTCFVVYGRSAKAVHARASRSTS